PAGGGDRRHLGADRAGDRADARRDGPRAQRAVRGGPAGRRRAGAGVCRAHPAERARGGRGGAHAERRGRVEDVRPGVRDDRGRARELDHGAGLRGVPAGVPHRAGGLGRGGGDHPDGADLRAQPGDQPAGGTAGGPMTTSRAETAMNYLLLVVVSAFALGPIVVVLVTSLQPDLGGGGIAWGNYAEAWSQGSFARYLRTSALVSATVLVVALTASVLAGYAFGTMTFRGSTVVFSLVLVGIMVPTEAIVVPLFYDLRTLGLTNTLWAVAFPQMAQSIAFGSYWMRAYFRTAPRSLMEAARLDGASERRVLWSILVPVGRPAIVTMTVLVFMWTWNEFL